MGTAFGVCGYNLMLNAHGVPLKYEYILPKPWSYLLEHSHLHNSPRWHFPWSHFSSLLINPLASRHLLILVATPPPECPVSWKLASKWSCLTLVKSVDRLER